MMLLRRGLALALLALAAGLVAAAASGLAGAWNGRSEEIAAGREMLGKLRAVAGRSREIDAALQQVRDNPGRAWFIDGASEALITAQLQQRLQDIAAANGAQVLRASEAEPRRHEEQDYRGVRIEITGTLEAIQRSLVEIETGIPYLFVERMQLGSDQGYGDARSEPVMQAELDVYGAALPASLRREGAQ